VIVRFSKYHGTGNDFVMIEDLRDEVRLGARDIAALCDRHRGVGADGLIRIAPAPDADFFMDYYNADGATAEMCGNGIRCMAKLVYDRGLTSKDELDVQTRAGLKHLILSIADGQVDGVTVDMGAPAFDRKAINMSGEPTETFIQEPLEVGGRMFTATALSMGNPHVVLFVEPGDDLDSMEVRELGSTVEHDPLFPAGTNVEFVAPGEEGIRVRVWERGSGETMACGTGACAALVASALARMTGRASGVEFPGGRLHVSWTDAGSVMLTGPAVWVFDGEVNPAWMARDHAVGAA
jgi:diaminopimelate epimerase